MGVRVATVSSVDNYPGTLVVRLVDSDNFDAHAATITFKAASPMFAVMWFIARVFFGHRARAISHSNNFSTTCLSSLLALFWISCSFVLLSTRGEHLWHAAGWGGVF